jgi:aminomethyltransferase
MENLKKTALVNVHEKLGARMISFAGYYMPVEFSGINDEHLTVRNSVGVFDVSHMGEFWVKGPNALDLIQKVCSNDASKLTPGKIQYTCLPNGRGGIVDDLLVYSFDSEKYLLVVNASNIDKDWNWINSQNSMKASLENASDNISQLAIQGPLAQNALQKLTDVQLSSLPYYTFKVGNMAGIHNCIISNTGYTGAGGFELYVDNKDAIKLFEAVMQAGKEFNIKPIGLAARDTLRLEMGYCLYGNDIDDTTSPIEAGLGWITKFTDQKNFIDKALLLKQKNEGVARKLIGFEMIDKGIPRHGYEIADQTELKIGIVTSGTMSPVLKTGIGMGYVPVAYTEPGTVIFLKIRDKLLKARVIKFPFIKQGQS